MFACESAINDFRSVLKLSSKLFCLKFRRYFRWPRIRKDCSAEICSFKFPQTPEWGGVANLF